MTTPNHNPTPENSPLPTVSPDICEAVASEIAADERYAVDSFAIMQKENPDLTARLSSFILAFAGYDKVRGKELMMASAVVYRTLRAQAEADAMNQQFQTPPSE